MGYFLHNRQLTYLIPGEPLLPGGWGRGNCCTMVLHMRHMCSKIKATLYTKPSTNTTISRRNSILRWALSHRVIHSVSVLELHKATPLMAFVMIIKGMGTWKNLSPIFHNPPKVIGVMLFPVCGNWDSVGLGPGQVVFLRFLSLRRFRPIASLLRVRWCFFRSGLYGGCLFKICAPAIWRRVPPQKRTARPWEILPIRNNRYYLIIGTAQ